MGTLVQWVVGVCWRRCVAGGGGEERRVGGPSACGVCKPVCWAVGLGLWSGAGRAAACSLLHPLSAGGSMSREISSMSKRLLGWFEGRGWARSRRFLPALASIMLLNIGPSPGGGGRGGVDGGGTVGWLEPGSSGVLWLLSAPI